MATFNEIRQRVNARGFHLKSVSEVMVNGQLVKRYHVTHCVHDRISYIPFKTLEEVEVWAEAFEPKEEPETWVIIGISADGDRVEVMDRAKFRSEVGALTVAFEVDFSTKRRKPEWAWVKRTQALKL